MRFTFLAVVACGSAAMRQGLGRSRAIAKIGDLVSKITTSPGDSLIALKVAAGIVNDIFVETGNATDHLSGNDAAVLGSVVDLVEQTIYSSMDGSNAADVSELAGAVATAAQCNADVAHRQSPEGDLGILQQQVEGKQTDLNTLQGIVDEKRTANSTAWTEFDTHLRQITPPPACPDLPARNMVVLDIFFEKSEYTMWFESQQPVYDGYREAFKGADAALSTAIENYEVQLAIRDQQYCDWKDVLEAACVAFDTCFGDASEFFSNTLVPRVTSDMNSRIEVKKAGDTLVHQIRFLLAEVNEQQTPPIDTSRFDIAFPLLPSKGICDMTPLSADEWVPTPMCEAEAQTSVVNGIYMIKASFDGRCLIFSGRGQDVYPSRHDWGNNNDFCGIGGGEHGLIGNKQGVWRIDALPSNPNLFTIKSNFDGRCLIFSGNGQNVYPSRHDWGSNNDFCGIGGGEQGLIANKQGVWMIERLET